MTTLHFVSGNPVSGIASIPCPANKRIRIIAIIASVTGTAAGDEISLIYAQSSNQFLLMTTTQQDTALATVAFFVGAAQTTPNAALIDPVTGVVTYGGGLVFANAPLPDVWLPFEITITISAPITSMTVTYETSD